jgi:hypothetical protein
MASYPPPLQYFQGIIYNPDFFTSISSYITLNYANQNYLTRVGTSLSASSLTQFAGNVTILGLLTISGGINISGGLTVDNLTVTGTSLFQGQSTFNLIPIIPSGYQFITNGSQTIDGTKTFNLIPVLPSGFQFITNGSQTIAGLKTFNSVITSTGINDSLSITSPTITGSTIVNGGTFNATNIAGTSTFYGLTANSINTNLITNPSTTLPINIGFPLGAIPLSTTTTGDPRNGFLIGWNGLTGSNGETDFTNLNQGGNQGGFLFNNIPVGGSLNKLASLLPLSGEGLRLYSYCGQLRLDDTNNGAFNTQLIQTNNQLFINSRGINTQLVLQCGNATAVTTNSLVLSASNVSPQVNLNPASTTTFNAFHPTTSLGNNISTNTTQYATVGYVNASIPTSLLGLNNIWTGTNEYKNTTNGIKTTAFGTLNSQYFGSGTGGSTNLVIGGNSLSTINVTNAQNIAICPSPSACLGPNIGNSNIALGTSCGINQSNANQNIFIGTTCGNGVTFGSNNVCLGSNAGNGVTTGSNNIVIGNSAWATTANFSNCTVIGASALAPISSNSIILGSTAETVYIAGASQINNTLMTGTTVVSNNIQVNGNIVQPILTFTTGVQNTFTTIPPYILYTPAVGQGFVLPPPSAANAGMQFIIRRVAVGSSSTIIFSCTGNPLVWVILNGTVATASYAVASLGASQSMWFSSGTLFYQLI